MIRELIRGGPRRRRRAGGRRRHARRRGGRRARPGRRGHVHLRRAVQARRAGCVGLRGNLAPDGRGGQGRRAPSGARHTGPARVFDSEEACIAAIAARRRSRPATCWSSATKARRAGRACGRCSAVTAAVVGVGARGVRGAGHRRAVLGRDARADGRHVSPEAARGGALAVVREGEQVTVDVDAGVLQLDVRRRRSSPPAWRPRAAARAVTRRRARPLRRARRLGVRRRHADLTGVAPRGRGGTARRGAGLRERDRPSVDRHVPAGVPGDRRGICTPAPRWVQLTLTACVAGLALGQLIIGPLSDRLGGRLPLLCAVVPPAAVASLLCAGGTDDRGADRAAVVQGFAGAGGVVIWRAIETDLYRVRRRCACSRR